MKSILLFCLMLFMYFFSSAQYAPIGAKWYYGYNNGSGIWGETYYAYECKSDTLINGETYSKISFADAQGINSSNINYYLLTDSNRTFYFHKEEKKLLFDFNKTIGDTFNIDISYGSYYIDMQLRNDSTKNVSIVITEMNFIKNGFSIDSLKSYRFKIITGQVSDYHSGRITQKVIGGVDFPVPFSLLNLLFVPVIPEASHYLRCYSDTGYNFKSFGFTKACDDVSVGINETRLKADDVNIYPNPTTGNLFINANKLQSDNVKIVISDITGRVLYNNKLNTKGSGLNEMIKLTELSAGVYFVTIAANQEFFCKKIIYVKP